MEKEMNLLHQIVSGAILDLVNELDLTKKQEDVFSEWTQERNLHFTAPKTQDWESYLSVITIRNDGCTENIGSSDQD